jgi:citrate lyase gamma subunit
MNLVRCSYRRYQYAVWVQRKEWDEKRTPVMHTSANMNIRTLSLANVWKGGLDCVVRAKLAIPISPEMCKWYFKTNSQHQSQ